MKQNEGLKPKRSGFKKILMVALILILVIVITILLAIPPYAMNDMIHGSVKFSRIYEAEEFSLSANRLSLTTSDGLKVRAYEVFQPAPKAVVVFVSGIHNPSVTAFYGHSKMLIAHGYASILLEMRAHGESEGELISFGYKEYLDLQAVVSYIKSEPKYADIPIVAFGVSMGGATVINATGKTPEIDAVISLSAYSSCEDMFCEYMAQMGAPAFFTAMQKPFVKLYTIFKFGIETKDITPERQIRRLGNRPALLAHSTEDSQVSFSNFERLTANAPAHVERWVREGDLHFIMKHSSLNPEEDTEYAQRILGFLEQHFGK